MEDRVRVDVWTVDLAPAPDVVERREALLDPREREQAATRSGDGRRRYVVAHGACREILAAATGTDPSEVLYLVPSGSEGARPSLMGEAAPSFSLTHAGDLALVAVTTAARVGIDVEVVRPRVHLGRLARRVLAPGEYATWRRAPAAARLVAFLDTWTAKEAYAKATGEGLRGPLVAIPSAPPSGWSGHRLTVGPVHVAALAIDVAAAEVHVCGWPEGTTGVSELSR